MTEILYQSSGSYLYLEYTGSQSGAGDWKGWSRLAVSILRHANHKEVSTQPSCASSLRAAFLLEPKRMQTQGRLTGQEEAGREDGGSAARSTESPQLSRMPDWVSLGQG